MPFFSKTHSPSSSLPSSPSVSNHSGNQSLNTSAKKRLQRQRKLRHVSDHDIGLDLADPSLTSPSDSCHPAGKQRSPCSMPHPLPLPELTLTKRSDSSGSNLGPGHHGSLEERPISALRRTSTDHIPTKSAKSLSNFRQRFSEYANMESSDFDFRLRIPARSAPTSGFSSPSASPQRPNAGDAGDPSDSCFAAESPKPASNCRWGVAHDVNVENSHWNLCWIGSPRSAPTSRFSSPAVSPQRANTVDFLSSFVASRESHGHSALEVPDFNRLTGYASPVPSPKDVHIPDHSPLHSPTLHSPGPNPKNPKRFSFPSPHKLNHASSKEWPESNGHVSAHPLPLPPGAGPSQSFIQSPPGSNHHTTERPNVSPVKGQWLKGRLIGHGTYGRVYYGTHRLTGASCAMKEVDIIPDDPKSAECIKQLEQEIRVLRQLRHPNIVQYYGSEIVDDHFYIYLELVHPGPINKYIREHCGRITESIVRNFTRHILLGLAYLHSTKTIHRDIKGANLLVNESGTVKLADFGTAKHLTGLSYELSLKGSPHWMAPEVIRAVMQKDANPDLALASDIWSLGCTVIEMFSGKPPWGELQGAQAMFKVLNKAPPIPETLPPEGKDFLHRCFQRDPAGRPSALKLLEHPFVRNPNDTNVSPCKKAMPALNLMDKTPNPRDDTLHKVDSMPASPGMQMMNGKQQSNSFNCSTASHHSPRHSPHHSPCPDHEIVPCLPVPQSVHASHSFSVSPHLSRNMPFGAGSNHPLAVLRSHGREVPHV